MTTLAEELAARAAASAAKMPGARKAAFGRSLEELAASGIADRALTVGDTAPDFTLPNAVGAKVTLSDLLEAGPVVVSFYRGAWCPYCNMELRALQAALDGLRTEGATLVAISPNTPDTSMSLVEKHQLSFPVLSDLGNVVARQFGLVFEVPAYLEAEYRSMGHDIGAANGDGGWELPLPATYVIDVERVIRYAFVDVDYKKRAEPADVIDAVRNLTRRSAAERDRT